MDVEYKRDLHRNYMVIKEEDNEVEQYGMKMINHNLIDGILSVERRVVNNQVLFYYDISAKQASHNLLDRASLSYQTVKQFFLNIISTIERAYEYLLIEDDFVLMPEFIYIDVVNENPYLCYLSGYQKDIKNQMSSLIEYIMNKVDYNDNEAVLFVYNMYAASREEGFTFDHIKKVLAKQNKNDLSLNNKKLCSTDDNTGELSSVNKRLLQNSTLLHRSKESYEIKAKNQEGKKESKEIIPVRLEKVEGELEILCYPIKTYLYTSACISMGVLIIVIGNMARVFYNAFGNRIDYSKLFALLIVIICAEGYILKKVWDKKNQITKIITKEEYINPIQEKEETKLQKISLKSHKERNNEDLCTISTTRDHNLVMLKETVHYDIKKEEHDCTPTCLLNEAYEKPRYQLKPKDELIYETIVITDFPFFIGKLKKNVDYCLEKSVVSRYHAKITKEQERFYITDLNSTNGTFLNNEPVQTYARKELKLGDEVALANIKYVFEK